MCTGIAVTSRCTNHVQAETSESACAVTRGPVECAPRLVSDRAYAARRASCPRLAEASLPYRRRWTATRRSSTRSRPSGGAPLSSSRAGPTSRSPQQTSRSTCGCTRSTSLYAPSSRRSPPSAPASPSSSTGASSRPSAPAARSPRRGRCEAARRRSGVRPSSPELRPIPGPAASVREGGHRRRRLGATHALRPARVRTL